MNEPLVIPARYCGPPTSGNGGYVAGSLAHRLPDVLGRPVTVSLRRPPPLDVPLTVAPGEDGLRLTDGDHLVATASFAETEVEPVEPVSHAAAVAASAAYPGLRSHPFPTCFGCGVDRPDGLRIFPGPVGDGPEGRTRVAAPWTPGDSIAADFHEYADSARRTCLAATWSALDCVGGWAGDLGKRLMVLGRMTAVIDALPVVGEPHVVMGEARGQDGRKTMTASTLVDANGRIVGRAEHLWIAVDPAAFGS